MQYPPPYHQPQPKEMSSWAKFFLIIGFFICLGFGSCFVLLTIGLNRYDQARSDPRSILNQSPRPAAESTPNLKLLEVVESKWERGGFDAVAIWRVTFHNRSDKPIGDIKYVTRYYSETGNLVDRGGIESPLGNKMIQKIIPPHQKRTIEVNDGFTHREAARASFDVVEWRFIENQP